jgi:hypothetical protein
MGFDVVGYRWPEAIIAKKDIAASKNNRPDPQPGREARSSFIHISGGHVMVRPSS